MERPESISSRAAVKVTMQSRVGSFDLKLIRSRPTDTGRRIVALLKPYANDSLWLTVE